MLAKPTASWDNDDNLLKSLEGIPGNNPFANGALPAAPPIPEAVTMEGYYTHPEFSPMPRRIHEGKVNLPENLTDPIRLFTFFYPHSLVETFVRATNKYAEKKIELERRGVSELSIHSRYLDWKPLTTRKTYIFLGILILMGSDRKPKFKDYWRIPRAAGKAISPFHNYMGLKRFETIYKLFTISPSSVNEPYVTSNINNPPRGAPTLKRKLTARGARPTGGLPPNH
jgi:hypothetical protein